MLLTEIKMWDASDQSIGISFDDVIINAPLADSSFEFSLPKGVDIFDQTYCRQRKRLISKWNLSDAVQPPLNSIRPISALSPTPLPRGRKDKNRSNGWPGKNRQSFS